MITLNPENQLGTLIENQFGDHYLFSVNQKNFEKIDYQTRFLQEYDNTFGKKDTLYIITGTDSGMMVKQLLKTPPEKGSAYVFIEFPEIIELTKNEYKLEDQKRIIVSTEEHWQEEAKKIGMDIYYTINKVKLIKSFAAQYYHINEYLFLHQYIEDTNNHLTWQYQSPLGSKEFVQKQLENIAENHTPGILLKDYFKGKSALILAGGPSLDNYIEWIEDNQQYYVVIAVTRIARRLLQTKIIPDIFISVDPHPANFNVSKEVFNFEKECLLVHQYHLSPMLLGNWLGANLYLGDLFPWETKLNKENLDGIGPTVTNTAIKLAIDMGIKQQILFGVDLCYSPEGYTHAKGSNEHDAGPDINSITQTVITNKGEKAETNSAYFEAINIIEELAKLAIVNNGKIINPSPDSTKMINVEHILIENIKTAQEQVSITPFLQKQLTRLEDSAFKVKHYQAVLKELNTAQFKVRKIEELANKGLGYNKKFFAHNNPEANFKFKLKMDKLEKELDHKDLIPFSNLAKKFGMKEFLYFLNPDSEREWTNEEIKQSGDIYYKALRTGAIELGRNIFTAVNRTEMRLLENNQLKVNDELIKRHLCSFDKSYLLDRQIVNQQNHINKNINKLTQEQKQQQLKHLEDLKNTKQETISNCENLYLTFKRKDSSLGKNNKEKIQVISFYLLMLQNEENYQSRRLSILTKENTELLFLPEYISILNDKPYSYIQRQKAIINTIVPQKQNLELLKLQNRIANLADNHTPISVLKDYFIGKSALILSDKITILEYSEWIEEHQNHFIIIALSHLAKELLTTEIKPDIFIATKPDERSFNDNKLIVHFEKHSILINQNHLLPKILGNWLGVNLYMGKLFPWDSELNIENVNYSKLDDANIAISLADHIGIKNKILFTGILSTIDDIKIPKENVSISSFLQQQRTKQDKTKCIISHYKKVLEELNKVQLKLNNTDKNLTQKQLADLMNLAEKFIKNDIIYSHNPNNTQNLKMGLYELSKHIFTAINRTEIRTIEQTQFVFNDNLINRHLCSFKQTTQLDYRPNRQIIVSNTKKVFEAYKLGAASLGKNISERNKSVTFFLILLQNALNVQGRRLLILENNNNKLLKFDNNITFHSSKANEMLKINLALLNSTFGFDTKIKFEGLEIKLYNLFILKDYKSIRKIIRGIELSINNNHDMETNPFLHLAKGYLYELNNQTDLAIEEYGYADNSKTRESALKRIALITLEKGEVEYAHRVLQILSEISPAYLPQLAELYSLTKNYKDALDTYTKYLDYNSSDISILLKVAKLYESLDIADGAQFIYNEILKLKPENIIAQGKLL